MKKIIYSLMLIGSIFGLTGCQDVTTEDHSVITHYVAFEMQGDPIMLVTVGTSYTDPGVIATENGEDVTNAVTVSGDAVDPNIIGLYNVVYSGTNVDGFETSVSRTVIVCNPAVTTDISGTYKSAAGTHRLRAGVTVNYSGYPVVVTKIAPGFFSVTDFWGGYYYPRLAGYANVYTMSGYVKLNLDNTIGLLSSKVKGWGDSLDGMANGVYDPTAQSLYWEVGYAGSMTFFVTLTK